jgi:hypothetical protein
VALTSGLAVVVIMWGGVGYVTSAGGGGIEEAKGRISAAIMGLLLALSSFIILKTINQDLLNVNFNLDPLNVPAGSPAPFVATGEAAPVTTSRETVDEFGYLIDADGNNIYDDEGNPIPGHVNSIGVSLPLRDAWGDPNANVMEGHTLSGRQTYYATGETHSDSNTDAGHSSYGQLVEGTPTTVGSAASVYYPPGTLVQVGGIKYIIDDNNLSRQSDGNYRPANDNLTNNHTVDIYTTDVHRANTTDTHNDMTVLYVPPTWSTSTDITDIRNNPDKYTSSN